MLKVRVIPTLLWKDVGLVKGEKFDSWRRVGTVMPSIKVYNTREVDELILLDITATGAKREPDYISIEELAAECFVPLTFGGGIWNIEIVKKVLRAGADKVAINSALFENPKLVSETADRFGSQCVIASLDVKKTGENSWECFSHSGTRPTGRDPILFAKELEKLGAGEILLTSIERDGTMTGYDLEITRRIAHELRIPVIASGGAGNYEHMFEALSVGAQAVAAAAIFHFTEQTPLESKAYLLQKGIPVRDSQKKIGKL
jgi:cyclase